MDGEQESIASVEAGTPIEPEMEQEQPVNLDAPETDVEAETDGAEAIQGPDDDLEEFEWNGKQIKAPKGLKDNLLMHADYTKKTQEVAATRKELEEREQRIAQQSQASEEELNARATLVSINQQLQQYANVNWDQLEQDDPIGAQQHWRKFQMLQQQKGQTVNDLAAKQYERTQLAQQEDAKRLEETYRFAQTIPGWSQDTDKRIVDYAASEGIELSVLKANITPQFYNILHKAMLGDAALKKQTTAPKPTAPSKPLTVVSAKKNAPATRSLAEMDMDEYVAARRAGRG